MVKNKKEIHIFAFAAQGVGISGSDRIFIEFARRWAKKNTVKIYVDQEGYEMCRRQSLVLSIKYLIFSIKYWKRFGFFVNYVARIIVSVKFGLTFRIKNSPSTIIYSASEFWMDSLPCFILKLRFTKVRWAAAWYQTAPNPLKGFAEGERKGKYRMSAFLYWFAQLPIKPLIAHFSDFVLINNEDEKKQFPLLDKKKRAIVVIGAVDLEKIAEWKKENGKQVKKYDAVFQGRFHPQKGVIELIDIWKKVTDQKPDAKLVMIGDGPLMKDVRLKIKELGLEKNVEILGYVFDGDKKYRTFAQSEIVLHPAFYDSGGMAAAEAMAFDLPCVGFELKSYKSYYPQGMLKVKIGDIAAFAYTVIKLLDERTLRTKISKEAFMMIQKNWGWDKRAGDILSRLE